MRISPATGGGLGARLLHVALAGAILIAVDGVGAHAQAPGGNLLNPTPGGFAAPQDLPLQLTSQADGSSGTDLAPSRIGKIPTYGTPAASGASDDGYDSLNRKRKKPKPYPGAPKLKGSIDRCHHLRLPTRRRWHPRWQEQCRVNRHAAD